MVDRLELAELLYEVKHSFGSMTEDEFGALLPSEKRMELLKILKDYEADPGAQRSSQMKKLQGVMPAS